MAKITFDVDDTEIQDVINGVCANFNYSDTINVEGENQPNPQSKDDFVSEQFANIAETFRVQFLRDNAVKAINNDVAAKKAAKGTPIKIG